MKNKLFKHSLISTLTLSLLIPGLASAATSDMRILPFSDVGYAHTNYQAIKYLYEHEIVNGYEDRTFRPEQKVNRVEALKIIFLSAGITPKATDRLSYIDVDIKQWYIPYLREALNRKIAEGYPDGSFKPENYISLVESLKMLITAQGIKPSDPAGDYITYIDASNTEWYSKYLKYAKDNNLLTVINNKAYPEHELTRGELSEIAYRLILVKNPPAPNTGTLPPVNNGTGTTTGGTTTGGTTGTGTGTTTGTGTATTAVGYEKYAAFESTNGKFKLLYPKNYFYGAVTYTSQYFVAPKLVFEFSKTSLDERDVTDSKYAATMRVHIFSKDEATAFRKATINALTVLESTVIDDTNKEVKVYKIEDLTKWPQAKTVMYRTLSDERLVLIENLTTTEDETIKTLASFKTTN